MQRSFTPTRSKAAAQRPQPAFGVAVAPLAVLADGIMAALERARLLPQRQGVRAMNALDDRMLEAIGPDRARILRAVLAREHIETAWFPGDPL